MGKVTTSVLPADHPLFTGGWVIATVRRPIKKDKKSSKDKSVVSPNKEDNK